MRCRKRHLMSGASPKKPTRPNRDTVEEHTEHQGRRPRIPDHQPYRNILGRPRPSHSRSAFSSQPYRDARLAWNTRLTETTTIPLEAEVPPDIFPSHIIVF